jgi:hypothetical protein
MAKVCGVVGGRCYVQTARIECAMKWRDDGAASYNLSYFGYMLYLSEGWCPEPGAAQAVLELSFEELDLFGTVKTP